MTFNKIPLKSHSEFAYNRFDKIILLRIRSNSKYFGLTLKKILTKNCAFS